VHAAHVHRNAQAAGGVRVEAGRRLGIDAAHEGEGQVRRAVARVAQQARRNPHVLADIGFAFDAVAEEQVGDAVGGFLQLHVGGRD
jgi:hypothetical protein